MILEYQFKIAYPFVEVSSNNRSLVLALV